MDEQRTLVLLVTRASSGVGRRMESTLARLQLQERAVRVATIDADAQPDLVRRLGVREVPSVVIVRDMKPLAWLPGRATLGQVERAIAEPARAGGAEV